MLWQVQCKTHPGGSMLPYMQAHCTQIQNDQAIKKPELHKQLLTDISEKATNRLAQKVAQELKVTLKSLVQLTMHVSLKTVLPALPAFSNGIIPSPKKNKSKKEGI